MAKIMLVDDSKLVRKKLTDIFTSAGHTVVHECEKGEDALDGYRDHRPDIVTMDINMPGMNGIEALTEIRNNFPDAKVVIITTNSQEKTILEAINKGASCFLVKPFSDEHVINTLNRLIRETQKQESAKKDPASHSHLEQGEKISGLILVVDDSKTALKRASEILMKDGHNVITALTGRDGVDLAKTGNPDLIILDVMLPDIDGYEVFKELKKDEFTKNIPVIMHTTKTRKDDILLAMKLGVADYISKSSDEKIISAKSRSAIVHARHKRKLLQKNSVNNIIIDRQEHTTYITFRFTMNSENAVNEMKKILTGAFLKTLSNTAVILDFRLIDEMNKGEINQVKHLFTFFPEKEMIVVCGKHYAVFASEFDMEDKNKFFISMGDAEMYTREKNNLQY